MAMNIMNWTSEDDLPTLFVMYKEGKMDRLHGMLSLDSTEDEHLLQTICEVGEGKPVTKALLFDNGTVSVIPGTSASLSNNGYKTYEDSHLNTQFALTVTQAFATLHAILRSKGIKLVENDNVVADGFESEGGHEYSSGNVYKKDISEIAVKNYMENGSLPNKDLWTGQVSRPSLISANLSLMCSHFRQENVSSRVINKLESLQGDVATFSQFMQFASAMQMNSQLQSVGPISMCDIWVPKTYNEEESENKLVIRLRGGENLKAPPMRDVTWVWLTLLRPDILQERYMELCESYCTAFNNMVKRHNASKSVEELTLFDVMRDLGDSFLHAFFTIVHKFTLSGVWCLDRNLHNPEGIHSMAESLGFLIDNGIIGSLLVL